MTRAVIAWVPYHRRSELLAQHLGASLHFVRPHAPRRRLNAPLRYAVQAARTWAILRRERPDVVLVQNPPIPAVLVAAVYAWLHRAHYIIDSHTGAFMSAEWRWSLGLHRVLSAGALTTIVHNAAQARIVEAWGCDHRVIGYTPGDYGGRCDYSLNGAFSVAVVSSFADDEPLEAVFAAARQHPDMALYLTGDATRASPALLASRPPNCHLTGYLPYDRYAGLLAGADAVMDLTSRDGTLLMGGFEAVSLGVPLITSDWPILRAYFDRGTVHVANTATGVAGGLRRARQENAALREGMRGLRRRLHAEWERALADLEGLIRGAEAARHASPARGWRR